VVSELLDFRAEDTRIKPPNTRGDSLHPDVDLLSDLRRVRELESLINRNPHDIALNRQITSLGVFGLLESLF
jgi:hypothetical protein